MSNTLFHIADRVLNRPLLITPDKAQIILEVVAGRIGVNSPEASRFEGDQFERDASGQPVRFKPYKVSSGVAIISIVGSLVNRGAWVGASSGLVSYEGIQHQLRSAARDETVRAVILDLSTPGGEAIGAFETAAAVRSLAAVKPVTAIVNGMAASAGYAIASGASEIVTTETGVSGSIGVVLLHADFSRYLANEGIQPTFIFAGAHKVDGNPFEPLGAAVREDLQSEVNAFYEQFLKTVATGRGARLSIDAARATEARTMIGEAAVAIGLADRVGTFESALADLQQVANRAPASGRTTSMKGKTMDTTTGAPAADAGISQADHQSAVAAAEQKGALTERTRLAAILGGEGIRGDAGRMAAAIDLAVKAPTMSAADVTAFVSANVAAAPAAGAATVSALLSKLDKAAEGVQSRPSTDGTAGAADAPKATTPEGWKAEYAASATIQAEFPTAEAYVAYQKRQAVKAA
ncbi:S49 family peptidase [Mesorhizobium sp. J428]|uniref:S49 family peptidase n=1 Tax=Mesorhizobium sp. J428 TaxID=2898440 RepID=UPI002151AF1F|nr:S49 family peptidase [Mesorhizobium sp. J428]MCR5859718.1 S49 family peptidase [Mesorhizobium sp. J428]